MKAIMTGTGGRAPPGQNRRSPSQDLVGLPEFAVLPLQRLDPLALVRGRPGPHALVAFSLAYPVPERLARAADLGRDRADRRMLRAVLALVFQHHPHRAFADLRRKGWGSLRHGSFLARSGASGKPRAVQRQAAIQQLPGEVSDLVVHDSPPPVTETRGTVYP